MSRSVSEIAQLLRQGMEAIDAQPLSDLFAADAVYEFPFAQRRVEGREAILAALTAGGARGRALGLEKAQVTTTETATGLVIELIAEGRDAQGEPYRFPSSVGILTIADGEITSYRDYPNAGAAAAMGHSGARAVFDRFLSASVDNRWDDLADCYAEDVVVELPFTPPGAPRLTRGREELRSRFKAAGALRRLVKADNVVVHETSDPAVLVTEFDLHNEWLADGSAFVSSYVMVLTVRDGEIVESRDYSDTAASAERIARFTASRSGSPEA